MLSLKLSRPYIPGGDKAVPKPKATINLNSLLGGEICICPSTAIPTLS